jgi:hypothetical protein
MSEGHLCGLNLPIKRVPLGYFDRHGDGWTNVRERDALGRRGEERARACSTVLNLGRGHGQESMRTHLPAGKSHFLVFTTHGYWLS